VLTDTIQNLHRKDAKEQSFAKKKYYKSFAALRLSRFFKLFFQQHVELTEIPLGRKRSQRVIALLQTQ
jgi:hypothetical protein